MLLDFLNKDFTLLDRKDNRYLLVLIVFGFSVFFINIFEPWNIGRWYSDSGIIKFLRLSSYGFVVGLVFLITQFPLRRILKVQVFKVKSYIFWLLVEVCLICLVYIFMYGNPIGNFLNDLGFALRYTLLGICIPYSFAILVIYYKNQREEINQLKGQISKPTEKKLVAFTDDKGKIRFSVQQKDVLFLEAADNYVSVFYILENKVQRELLRNTLKHLEEELKENAVIRCHRSYMVNIQNIEFVKKEGKKLLVKVKETDRFIAVSPKYSPLFIDFLS